MTLTNKIAAYFDWADQTLFDIIQTLTKEEFALPFSTYNRSICSITLHLAEDHWWWYHFLTKKEFEEKPDFEAMSKEELLEFISAYRRKWIDLAKNRPCDTVTVVRENKTFSLSFEELIFHIATHATYHRGQLALALRFLGKSVPFTDYVPYRAVTD